MLQEYECCREIMRNIFNKILVMAINDESNFRVVNKFLICRKTYVERDNKVKEHNDITVK